MSKYKIEPKIRIDSIKNKHQVEEILNLISDILEVLDNVIEKYEGEIVTFETNTIYLKYISLKDNLEFCFEYFIKFDEIVINRSNDFVNPHDFIKYVSEHVFKINAELKKINLIALEDPDKIITPDTELLLEVIKHISKLCLKTGMSLYDE